MSERTTESQRAQREEPQRKHYYLFFISFLLLCVSSLCVLCDSVVRSLLQRVQHGGGGEALGARPVVPAAVAGLVVLQRAADVVLAVDHHPPAVQLDAFQK